MSQALRILSIDPGTTTLGFGLLEIDAVTLGLTVRSAGTFNASKQYRPSSFWTEWHDPQILRIQFLSSAVSQLLWETRPDIIACESPFSHNHPEAFAALARIQLAIYNCIRQYDLSKSMILVSPNEAKKSVGAVMGKEANKANVRDCVLSQPMGWDPAMYPTLLDEHSIDAVAVGVFIAKKIQLNPYIY